MRVLLVSVLLSLLVGCATIVSQSRYPVSINSSPSRVDYEVVNKKGQTVASGTTPDVIQLNSGSSYFSGEEYKIKFSKPGFEPKVFTLNTSINGWYFGNFIFGSWIGFLIVDPITGAMWRLPDGAYANLPPKLVSSNGLKVLSLSEVPEETKLKMERIN